MGYDTLVRFFDRKYYEDQFEIMVSEFFKTGSILVYDRGLHQDSFWDRKELKLGQKYKEKIEVVCAFEGQDVSSSRVRQLLTLYYKSHQVSLLNELQSIVPTKILDYILERQLYKD